VTSLVRLGTSALYLPDSGEAFAFLLWTPPTPPLDAIPLEDTWGADAPAARIGCHVFLDARPAAGAAPALEAELRGALPPDPVTTGFAWARTAPAFACLAAAAVTFADGDAVLAADVPIPVPDPMPGLTLARDLRVRATAGLAGWWVFDARSSPGPAISVPLLGPAAGDVRFEALLASPVADDTTVKALAEVRADPLRPYDPDRTAIIPLGPEYRVSEGPAGVFRLAPATA